nr:VENN motif pre-toxin domain-containing protein [Moraxella bovoculi]
MANYLYGTKDPSELNQEQKDTITSILNLATATAIYTATDGSTTDAVSGAEIGKVGVEWNFNAIQQSSAANARACRGGKVSACEVRTLGDILGEYADKYHDLTIYSVGLGAVSYTVIVNNKNGNVWVGGVPESDNYRAGYGLSTHPRNLDLRNLIKTLEEDAKNGKTPRVIDWKLGVSAQAGTVVGATTPEEVDKAIGGRSLGAQACHVGCLSISKGEGKDGAVILAIGAGTSQIGIGGNVMRQLTDNEKKTLKDLGLLR